MEFEAVIGLEIHVQLNTNSKAFCGDSTIFGIAPNTQISAISLGYPGTLPMHNVAAIASATKLGLALNCDINRNNQYARKNYFYADLPKGYQISQDKTPICTNGFVPIQTDNGIKNIILTRIHMEEDSGKSMHDQDLYDTLIDYNRAGIPLVEIVSEPEIKNGDEAYQFLFEVRRLVRYLDICDGNMEEGSLRCDANISVMPKGSKTFGVKVEVKNMNSMTNVKRAIQHEIDRQIEAIQNGEIIVSETRSFNAAKGTTTSMRSKEEAQDYRYFPEPDLPPFIITDEFLAKVKSELPTLPNELIATYITSLQIPEKDAAILADDKETAAYFQSLYPLVEIPKTAANWMLSSVKSWLNENAKSITEFPLNPDKLAEIIHLVSTQKISHTAAATTLFPAMVLQPEANALALAMDLNLLMNDNSSELAGFIQASLADFPDKVEAYKSGKTGLLGMFVGDIMKRSKGNADPKLVNKLLLEALTR